MLAWMKKRVPLQNPTDHSELARQGHFEVEAMSIPRNMKKRKRQKCVTWSNAS